MKILNKNQSRKFTQLAVERLAEYLKENKLSGITLGISGGIDSAVVAIIGLRTINYLNSIGYQSGYEYLFLDCASDKSDYNRAKILADKFSFKLKYIDLTDWYIKSPLLKLIPSNHPREKISHGNIKCRLRMITLYNSASLNNYIYLDTDDLSEEWMGFWTRHGDEGDVKIIQHVTKTEVYDIGKSLNIPNEILLTEPGDGLKVTKNNLAKDQLGLDYIYIEYIMSRFIGNGFDYNGSIKQTEQNKFVKLINQVSNEIAKPKSLIIKILFQALKTSYKRKYGDFAAHLLPKRNEFGFFDIGSDQFNNLYLNAINQL